MKSVEGGGVTPPILSILQESWSNVRHAAREMVTVFSVTFFLVTVACQIVKMPLSPKESASAHLCVLFKAFDCQRCSGVISKVLTEGSSRCNALKWVWPICCHTHISKDRDMII